MIHAVVDTLQFAPMVDALGQAGGTKPLTFSEPRKSSISCIMCRESDLSFPSMCQEILARKFYHAYAFVCTTIPMGRATTVGQ